ncbi:hypothetical protein D3C80_1108690 [compost metagenome]
MATKFSAILFDGGWRNDEAGRIGKVRQERRERFFQFELDCVCIERIDAFNGFKVEGEGERAGIIERMILVQHPLEIEFDRFRVEIRTVVELHALSQLERIGLAVIRN